MLNFVVMKQLVHIIALRSIRHSDRHNILRAYSREMGNVAFAVSAANSCEAVRRRALLMPLGVVECVAVRRPGSDILSMSDARSIFQSMDLRSDPAKNAVALFLAEFLGAVLREGPPDEMLYDFLLHSIGVLDAAPHHAVANFHICFLIALAAHLGISPDFGSYRTGMVFDLIDGCFRSTAPLHGQYLGRMESHSVAMLSRMHYGNMHIFRYSRASRNEVLDGILRYYEMHYTRLRELQSPAVLRELF